MRKPSGSSIDQKLFNREYNLILNGEPSLEELLNDRETLLILNKFKQAKEEMFSKENEEYNKVLYRSIAELRRTNLEAFKDYLAGDMNVLWGHPDLAKHSYCRRVMLYCRRVRGLSIREISLLAGIGYDTYRKVEWGADCFVSVLERIADVLRTSLDTIAPVSEVKGIREYNLELYNIKDIGVNSVITNEIVNKGWVYSPKNDEKLNGFVDETSNKSLLLNNIVNEFENESKNIKTLKMMNC